MANQNLNQAVRRIVYLTMHEGVARDAYWAVNLAVHRAVGGAVDQTVYWAVVWAVYQAVGLALHGDAEQPEESPHPGLMLYLEVVA